MSNTPLMSADLWRTNPDVICADFLIPGADPKIYEEVNLTDLQNIVEDYLSEYNAESKQPMQLVMFKDALLHVVRISRVLRQPSGRCRWQWSSIAHSLSFLYLLLASFAIRLALLSNGYGINELASCKLASKQLNYMTQERKL
eukprot:scaffold1793_cov164-Ochromonas_danica.AAC.2